jgi:hypothetical protein
MFLVFRCCWRMLLWHILLLLLYIPNVASLLLLVSLQLLCHCFCCLTAVAGIPAVTVFLLLLAFLLLLTFLLLLALLLLQAFLLLLAHALVAYPVVAVIHFLMLHPSCYWRPCSCCVTAFTASLLLLEFLLLLYSFCCWHSCCC